MKSKTMVLAVLTGLLVGLLIMPAAANKVQDKDPVQGGVKDAGTVTGATPGDVKVGKNRTFCNHDGTSDVSGPGIGLPTQATKNGYWMATLAVRSLVNQHVGTLKACGRLTKMNSNVNGGMGAACGASKGWDGRGSIHFPDKGVTIWLKELGWKVSVGGTLPVTGRAVQAADEPTAKQKLPNSNDQVVAEINASGAAACANKNDANKAAGPGATLFTANGTYELLQGSPPDQSAGPYCKSGGPTCLYQTKKTGKNG